MQGTMGKGWLGALVVSVSVVGPAAAQQPTNEDLRKDIQALQESLKALQKDLQDIKGMLARPAAPPSAVGQVIDLGTSPVRGERTAKLTLVEFSDYQCPFCGKYVRETYPQIETEYIKTGKVKSVFVDMPLESIHKFAFKAAQAAHCAGEEGKYWEMHDRLFESQKALEPWTPHAEAVGLDVPKFEACLASGKFDPEIRKDMAEAQRVGVTGTPAFMIARTDPGNSKVKVLAVLRGARAFADFKTEFDKLLEEPKPPAAPAGTQP